MITLHLIFVVLAIICFAAAAAGVASRVHLGWLGMVLLALAIL